MGVVTVTCHHDISETMQNRDSYNGTQIENQMGYRSNDMIVNDLE